MVNKLFHYFKIWLMMSKNSFLIVLSQKKLLFIFLFGRFLRFSFFLLFLYFLIIGTETLVGYTANQVIFFFLTFNLIDIVSQFLFREVYRFRGMVVSGDFDLVLVKPFSPLFRSLMGGADFIDLITIVPLFFGLIYVGRFLSPTPFQILSYLLLIICGLLVSTAFHIFVLSIGIITLEIDHTIMIYRDLVSLGRFPIDIYREPLRSFLTFILPVSIMISLPVKVFIGLVKPTVVLFSFVFAIFLITISIRFWRFALTKYTSTSS